MIEMTKLNHKRESTRKKEGDEMTDIMASLVGFDCTFELDKYEKPRLCSESETIKNVVMFILFSRPGQYPSLPYLGMDIRSRLYSFYDELDESDLEEQLTAQCSALGTYFSSGAISVKKMMYRGMPSMIIRVSTDITDSYTAQYVRQNRQEAGTEFLIGLSVNELNEMITNINARPIERY
jgi:hypothetical protein